MIELSENFNANGVARGEAGGEALEALSKALTAGYGTDVATFQGGSALRVQSLDRTMKSTIQTHKHFKLFNALAKSRATATVDEWTERNSVGGFRGGTTNTETGVIAQAQGDYKRRVGLVKYMMTRAEVSLVSTLGVNIASSEAVEGEAACLRLLTDAEHMSFEGDSAVVPTEFDGVYAQMLAGIADGSVDSNNLINADGGALASINTVNQAAAQAARAGNFGRVSHLFMSLNTQADFDTGLDPAFRVPLPGVPDSGIKLGAPVVGIRTSQGSIATENDVFVRDEMELVPFQIAYPTLYGANAGLAPTISPAVATGSAANKFTASRAGNYFYAVTGVNANGESVIVATTAQAVASGQKVTLTITASGGGLETGYAIYRSKQNAVAPTAADYRLIKRIPKTNSSTVFVDENLDIPGTSKAYFLNMTPGADAIAWRQLLPMLKFQLYPTNAPVLPWAQLLFGYLRLAKRRQHVVVKNVMPGGNQWRPFTAE